MFRRLILLPIVLGTALLTTASASPALAQPSPAAITASDQTSASSGVWYEIFVRSFADSNGDGIGDLNGVTAKLDYLKSLSVSGIWLMPINPSPSYHGYDVTDYYGINPQYGTLADFDHLLRAAHQRGIKVIIDLVINHSSREHPWFKAARDPHSPYHDWYNWSRKGTDLAAISATGAPAWHALGKQHYLGIFTADMPDFDYDTPAVRREMIKIGQFWLKRGVDGFRLDAAQHIYFDLKSERDDPRILAKNLAWWSEFRQGMDVVDPRAFIVGEVTRDTTAELAPYFKPLSAVFDFPLAVRLIDSAKSERAGNLGEFLAQTDAALHASSGKHGVDAPFLSNHDQDRVMSQLDGNPEHMRMAAAMLLTLPGHPFIYYGEEIGMRGSKPDPDIREPMRWDRGTHMAGEATWKTSTSHDGPAVSVEAELSTPDSLLDFYRTLIHWRSEIEPLRDGAVQDFAAGNPHIVAFRLSDPHGRVLVLHNLSGQAQSVSLDATDGRFDQILRQTHPVSLHGSELQMPPYTSAVLQ